MKNSIALAGLFIGLLPTMLLAAPAKSHPAKAAAKVPIMYECSVCHMKVSAAVAKKDGYKDSMDGGKLVPVKSAK